MKEIATPDLDDSVALAMKHISSRLRISDLDIVDGLKQLLYGKRYDLAY